MRLDNKLALVTGAASGIGRAIAISLAEAGGTVIAVDRDAEGLAEVVGTIGDRAAARVVDLSDARAILALRDEVVTAVGLPAVIVNAAGFDRVEPFMSNDDALWESLVAVNFLGPVRLTRAFLEPIIAAGGGTRIVNIASDAGRVGSLGETVYAGTKGGLIAFTKSLAREMARYQINVNCVCPGPTDTPLFASLPEKVRDGLIRAIPFRRLAKPEEVAAAVLFFASEYSSFITGQVLSVSGGLTMAGRPGRSPQQSRSVNIRTAVSTTASRSSVRLASGNAGRIHSADWLSTPCRHCSETSGFGQSNSPAARPASTTRRKIASWRRRLSFMVSPKIAGHDFGQENTVATSGAVSVRMRTCSRISARSCTRQLWSRTASRWASRRLMTSTVSASSTAVTSSSLPEK